MSTILVDIQEQDLSNFIIVNSYELCSINEGAHESLFKNCPFTLYKKRMVGESFVTINISITSYCLFLVNGLIK